MLRTSQISPSDITEEAPPYSSSMMATSANLPSNAVDTVNEAASRPAEHHDHHDDSATAPPPPYAQERGEGVL